jgi:hypothetical protein
LWLTFFFETYTYEVKNQYYVYGSDSFIADIGGYLGLCLGMSIHTFYDGAVMLVVKTLGLIRKAGDDVRIKKMAGDP